MVESCIDDIINFLWNSTNEYSNYTLISQCKPTHDEINSVIQIENGQILITVRDQSLILFSAISNNDILLTHKFNIFKN